MKNSQKSFHKLLFPQSILLIVLFVSGCSSNENKGTGTEAVRKRPNIIFILADDLGYGDLSCFGQTNFITPHLDKMASDGMKFTDFYAGTAVCAPSRSVLLTGLHHGNTPVRANTMQVVQPDGTIKHQGRSFLPEEITIGEVLKDAGYQTGIIGKWGLGEIDDTGHPNDQGFDFFYGFLNHIHAHNHFPDFLWRNKTRETLPNVVQDVDCSYCYKFGFEGGVSTERIEYADHLIRDEALEFIERNQDAPFFLYVPLISPHANNEADQVDWAHGMETPDYGEFENKDWPDTAKGYAAMVQHIDNTVGAIRAKIEKLGLGKDTIIMFSADNGPHAEAGNDPDFHDSNGPLRGIKRDLYEGGIRMPTIAWGEGWVPKGTVSDHPAYFGDLMATFAELAEGTVPDINDSTSFVPTLTGNPKAQKPHEFLYWEFYSHGSSQAVRIGKWKAIRIPILTGPIELYDLENDIGETTNLASKHPDIVAEADALMKANHHPEPFWIPDTQGLSPDRLQNPKISRK